MKLISLLILSLSLNVHAVIDQLKVQHQLDLIKTDFKSFYLTNPNHSPERLRFSPDENYVELKNLRKRKLLFNGVLKAGMEENERVEDFIVIDQECFDVNPAAWHMSIVNQVGRQKKSFVFDATYDYQVWNHPVISYEIKYFNLVSMDAVDSLEEAIVKREEFEKTTLLSTIQVKHDSLSEFS